MRRAAAVLIATASAACWDVPEGDWKPQSFIEGLRILGVRAEPPEVEPGANATVDALVVEPAGNAFTYVWLVCDPDPTAALGSACARLDTARDAASLLASPPPGVRIVTGPPSIEYAAPATALDGLPPALKAIGVDATVALFVFTGSDPTDARAAREIAIKRVRVRPRDANTNVNPRLASVLLGNSILAEDVPGSVKANTRVALTARVAPDASQPFTRVLPDGTTSAQQETLVVSWLSTAGLFDSGQYSLGDRTDPDETILLKLDDTPRAEVYVLLRDARGGLDWTRRTLSTEP